MKKHYKWSSMANTPSNIEFAISHGYEVYGYSEYNSEGFPYKVELIKEVNSSPSSDSNNDSQNEK